EKAKADERERQLRILDTPLFETTVISDDEDSAGEPSKAAVGRPEPAETAVDPQPAETAVDPQPAETAVDPEPAETAELAVIDLDGESPAEIAGADLPGESIAEMEALACAPLPGLIESLDEIEACQEMIEACSEEPEVIAIEDEVPAAPKRTAEDMEADGSYKYPVPLPVPSMDAILEKAAVADAPVYGAQGQDGGAAKKRRKVPKDRVDAKVAKGDPKAVPGMAAAELAEEDLSGLTRQELIEKHGAFEPPVHVTTNHVYSNTYHNFAKKGLEGMQLRAKARQSTGIFKQHRLCLPALVTSFRAKHAPRKPAAEEEEDGPAKS
ncbi:unnamed protein product, partial [Symbiodinium microadriaticum]